jgi:alpha-L-fucosidase
MKKLAVLVAMQVCLCAMTGAAVLETVAEGFDPGAGQSLAVHVTPAKSVDTGYSWSGYQGNLWGMSLIDDRNEGLGQCLDFSGVGRGYDTLNAWTVFNGDSVKGLKSIVFQWSAKSASYNMEVHAVIKDAQGGWFVSDDKVADIAATKQVIDAAKTTWRKLASEPVIGKVLSIGDAGTPDLSKVYGGGLVTVGTGSGAQTRLDTLIFTSKKIDLAAETIKNRGKPTAAQISYHNDEVMMFVHWGPATWQGVEYNNHSTPLEQINPTKLDTDQWCQAAQSFGAKRIIHVAKHTGNFLWWNSDLSDYGIKHTPYKDGKGDVVDMLAASCNKYGLKYGVYIYAHRTTQEMYRKELKEVISKDVFKKYGPVCEIWFDGGMQGETMDIIGKYAPDAILFGGPAGHMTARWPGSESGYSPEPAWQTVMKRPSFDGYTGSHSDADGNLWIPMEMDTTLLDHYWFWAPNRDHLIKSLDHLMATYYRSVGRGGVLLLNSTPDTTGLIPQSHMKRYKEFGDAIKRLYAGIKGETSGNKKTLMLEFKKPTAVNHIITMEDIKHGHIVRKYEIDGWIDGAWKKLVEGDAIGHKRIDLVETVTVDKLRFRATESVDTPRIRSFAAYEAPIYKHNFGGADSDWQTVVEWQKVLTQQTAVHEIDLTPYITAPGQYELKIQQHPWIGTPQYEKVVTVMAGIEEPDKIEAITGGQWHRMWRINRTAAVDDSELGKTVLRIKGKFPSGQDNSLLIMIKRVF